MHLLDSQGVSFSLLCVGLLEVLVFMHIYGKKKTKVFF